MIYLKLNLQYKLGPFSFASLSVLKFDVIVLKTRATLLFDHNFLPCISKGYVCAYLWVRYINFPKQLLWFWFYDTQSNTLSDGNLPFTVNRTTFRESPMMFVAAH